jgi:L-alanine-DL-glutamate epimerase-like enolase superfamily enzyme
MTRIAIDGIDVSTYTVPTDAPESDGTFAWDSTTVVVVEVSAGGHVGVGWTYEHAAAATLIDDLLSGVIHGGDALAVQRRWDDMVHAVRNIRLPGIAAYAISAVDIALWDLKARVLDLPLVDVLDARHETVPVYGSGGFTSYSVDRLREQLGGWVDAGIPRVKMKVGRDPAADVGRVAAACDAIGSDAQLYVDANGALTRQAALSFAEQYAEHGVTWFEEPVSSDDLDGLRLLRDRSPAGMEISAGEYGTVLPEFRALLAAQAVDCLQADVTRCGGITGVRLVAALCESEQVDLSAHTAPQISAHAFAAIGPLRHIEWFHDHVRIEALLFDGTLKPVDGALRPDLDRPGHGLTFRRTDAEAHLVSRSTHG